MKKEVLETLQYLINDREIVGEELQLTNEAFLSLTTKEKIEIQEELTKYIKEYIRVTSIFNMANNYDLNTEPSITTSEILQDLLNAASDYIENEDLEYNLISILRMSIMDSVEEEINLIEEFQKQGKKELTGIINFKLISALGRLEILRSMLLTEQKQEDYAIEPSISSTEIKDGDLFLICSDGLTDMCSDEEIATILGSDMSLKSKAELLVKAALENGGKDNVTVISGKITEDKGRHRWTESKKSGRDGIR